MSEQQEAEELSVKIARASRGVHTAVENMLAQPVNIADLVKLWTDPAGAWGALLDALPWDQAKVARASFTRLKALIGADGLVRDHGWENGVSLISVATIETHVVALEAALVPFIKLRKALDTQRRAAA